MKRMANFDALRILMAYMVVLLHISAGLWGEFDVSTTEFKWASLMNNLVRSSVPIFVMISGYFNLKRPLSLRRNLKKALRLFLLFVFWSFFYAVIDYSGPFTFRGFLEQLVAGKYHLWFLLNLCWCYLLGPLAHAIKEYRDGKYLSYMMIFFFLFGAVKLTVSNFLDMTEHYFIAKAFNQYTLFYFSDMLNYFVLGYYLSLVRVEIKNRYLILAYIVLALINTCLTNYYSASLGNPVGTFIDYYNILVFFESVILFKIFINFEKSEFLQRESRYFAAVSSLTFGVFLLHPMYLDMLNVVHNPILLKYPVTAVLFALLVFAATGCVTLVCLKIPLVKELFK